MITLEDVQLRPDLGLKHSPEFVSSLVKDCSQANRYRVAYHRCCHGLRLPLLFMNEPLAQGPPNLNSLRPDKWEHDRVIAREQIIDWLATTSSIVSKRSEVLTQVQGALRILESEKSIEGAIQRDASVVTVLRALTRRDVGTSQTATFLGVSTTTLENVENRKRNPSHLTKPLAELLKRELDPELASWIIEGRDAFNDEMMISRIVATDRIIRRAAATALRYEHEPRQLAKLESYLQSRGFQEVASDTIVNPRTDMPKNSYSFRVNVVGLTTDGVELRQNVDTLIKPASQSSASLPIFVEAKSMTDEVNPNKRQKEEAQKVDAVRRKWQSSHEKLNFVLLLGGTVPRRYLEIEAGSGLDWVWEHRVQDLGALLDWYTTI